jgi:hypothetical protein
MQVYLIAEDTTHWQQIVNFTFLLKNKHNKNLKRGFWSFTYIGADVVLVMHMPLDLSVCSHIPAQKQSYNCFSLLGFTQTNLEIERQKMGSPIPL